MNPVVQQAIHDLYSQFLKGKKVTLNQVLTEFLGEKASTDVNDLQRAYSVIAATRKTGVTEGIYIGYLGDKLYGMPKTKDEEEFVLHYHGRRAQHEVTLAKLAYDHGKTLKILPPGLQHVRLELPQLHA